MKERAFSVVICTDGRLPFLKETIRGLEALEYGAFELCVVCGPTEDGARAWLEARRSAIKIAHCPARNLSQARNIGIALAAGEIVAFLDDDGVPEPEWLADLNAAYDDPRVVAAGGVVYDNTGLAFQARYVTIDRLGYSNGYWAAPAPRLNYPFSAEFPHLLGANCSFRRRTLLDLGGFDEEYEYFLDETDLITRVNDAGGLIAQLPCAAVHHRYAPSTLRKANRVPRHWRPLIKNRVYFGMRNGANHCSPWEILSSAISEVEHLRRDLENNIATGELTLPDRARFEEEALSGFSDGLAAARVPQRKLMREPKPPPPFLPFPTLRPPGGRLCLALVTQDYPPGQNGGIARNVFELARTWVALGHHVHVFTRNRAATPSLDFEDGVWVHRIEPPEGAPPPDLVAPEAIPQHIWDHSRAMFEEVAKLDARRRVDLVYAPLWDCEPVAFLHEPRFPLVCALQTTMDFWLDSQPERRRDPEWMRARGAPLLALERWILARAPLLHANSRAIVEDISRRYALNFSCDRLIFAPHGLSDWAQGAQAPRSDEALRFLFVGRLESRKGIDTLLAAAPDVLRRFPDARLDIVGDDSIDGGKYKAGFLARPDLEDLASRVAFHGRVEEEALRAHYRNCDVLVAPSRYESFGLVYVEGMIFGKAVIGGRDGGGPEVIEEGVTGLTVAPGDADGLAKAMMRLAADAEMRRTMGAAGRRRYEERFRGEIAAKGLLEGARGMRPAG
jgi:glycosyltransferase involved in cell wall biosynthesis/GT2 family glycosyltransferase